MYGNAGSLAFHSTLLPVGLRPCYSGSMTLQGVPALCLRSDGSELWGAFIFPTPGPRWPSVNGEQ